MVPLGPLLGHDHRADHGHEQQNRSDFEWQKVGLEKAPGYGFGIGWESVHGSRGKDRDSLAGHFASGPKHQAYLRGQREGDEQRDPLLPGKLQLAHRGVEIHQHDYENKQHHDAADVKNDLYDEKKLGAKLEKDSGGGQESGNQKDRAVDDVAARDRQDRADDRDRGKKVKDDLIKHTNPGRRCWLSVA